MKIEITVSQRGFVLFTTDPNASWTLERIREILVVFQKKFPQREGFKIMISVDRQEYDQYESPNEFLRAHFSGPHY